MTENGPTRQTDGFSVRARGLDTPGQAHRGVQDTTYALGVSIEQAQAACRVARHAVIEARHVEYVVQAQAVHALDERGMSVRDMAAVLVISKRAIRQVLRHGHVGFASPADRSSTTRAAITAAWTIEDSASAGGIR